MKKITFFIGIVALIVAGLGVYSCKKGEEDESNFSKQRVTLKFELKDEKIKEVVSDVVYIDKVPKLASDELKEIVAKDKETNKKISVFILKEAEKSAKLSTLSMNVIASSENGNCQPSITRGYGFDGRCFSYGTIYVGSNCEQIFVPALVTEYIGFDRICPDWNGAFAKDNQTPLSQ